MFIISTEANELLAYKIKRKVSICFMFLFDVFRATQNDQKMLKFSCYSE